MNECRKSYLSIVCSASTLLTSIFSRLHYLLPNKNDFLRQLLLQCFLFFFTDGSTAVKRAKVFGEVVPPPPPPPPPLTGASTTTTTTTSKEVHEVTKTATTFTTSTTTIASVAETTAVTNLSVGGEGGQAEGLVGADGTLLSTASLAHDDDMDLDDDPPGEEGVPTVLSAMVSSASKSPSKTLPVGSVRSPRVSNQSTLVVPDAFDSVATTWVSAPTVSSQLQAHYGQGFLMPTASTVPSLSAASLYNPLAAMQAQVNPFTAAQYAANPYQMANNHPLTLVNQIQAPSNSHFVLPGAAQPSNLLALRFQQMHQAAAASQTLQLQQAAASHNLQQLQQAAAASQNLQQLQQLQQLQAAAAAQSLQQLPGGAASQLLAAQQPTSAAAAAAAAAAASSQLLASQAAAASVLPQPHVLSLPEELDPLRMILQKR